MPYPRWGFAVCIPCDPHRDTDGQGNWRPKCKYKKKSDCERDCQTTGLLPFIGCSVDRHGQHLPWEPPPLESAGQSSSSWQPNSSASLTAAVGSALAMRVSQVSEVPENMAAVRMGNNMGSPSAAIAPTRGYGPVSSVALGYRPSGGVKHKCACDSGFGWQQHGEHPCGCRKNLATGSTGRQGEDTAMLGSSSPGALGAVLRSSVTAGFDAGGGHLASSAPASSCGKKCGLDVTARLAQLEIAVWTYLRMRADIRQSLCTGTTTHGLPGTTVAFSNAWDICELAWGWGVFSNGNCGTCEKTVTVDGSCYASDDVNYVLLGVVAAACESSTSYIHGFAETLRQYRTAKAIFGERAGFWGRYCWLLNGYLTWKRMMSETYSLSTADVGLAGKRDRACRKAREEFIDCVTCDQEYKGHLRARIRQYREGEPGLVHQISTSGRIRTMEVLGSPHFPVPNQNCGE